MKQYGYLKLLVFSSAIAVLASAAFISTQSAHAAWEKCSNETKVSRGSVIRSMKTLLRIKGSRKGKDGCVLQGSSTVRYGANGGFTTRKFTGLDPIESERAVVPCTNRAFGDPIRGVKKECWRQVPDKRKGWVYCAHEHNLCWFSGGKKSIRYGENGSYSYKTVTSPVRCNNKKFGDPIRHVKKSCWVKY